MVNGNGNGRQDHPLAKHVKEGRFLEEILAAEDQKRIPVNLTNITFSKEMTGEQFEEMFYAFCTSQGIPYKNGEVIVQTFAYLVTGEMTRRDMEATCAKYPHTRISEATESDLELARQMKEEQEKIKNPRYPTMPRQDQSKLPYDEGTETPSTLDVRQSSTKIPRSRVDPVAWQMEVQRAQEEQKKGRSGISRPYRDRSSQ